MELETGQAASFLAMVGCHNHCVSDVMRMSLDFQAVASEISPALRVSFLVSQTVDRHSSPSFQVWDTDFKGKWTQKHGLVTMDSKAWTDNLLVSPCTMFAIVLVAQQQVFVRLGMTFR